jgi:hypothetical protein
VQRLGDHHEVDTGVWKPGGRSLAGTVVAAGTRRPLPHLGVGLDADDREPTARELAAGDAGTTADVGHLPTRRHRCGGQDPVQQRLGVAWPMRRVVGGSHAEPLARIEHASIMAERAATPAAA